MARKRKAKKWKPFKAPVKPPPNTYDPALDSQQRAAERGLFDLSQDISTVNERTLSDFLLGQQSLGRQRDEGLADIGRQRQGISRSYRQLANRQAQSARVAGVQRGGALTQAMAKRTANENLDMEPTRIAEQRLREGTDRQLGELATNYRRAYEDNNLVKLPRAQRELGFFKQDIGTQRFYQAKQGGYVAPTKPKNEFTKHGVTYRADLSKPVSQRTYTLPNGQVFTRSEWRRYIRRRKGQA